MTHFNISGKFHMTARPRMKMLAVSIGVALAQWGGSALADSSTGVDMANGNALNPPGRSSVPRTLAEDGPDTVRHSPTGQLYGMPYDRSDERTKTESGWEYTGSIEAGVLGGDANNKSAQFRQYKDLKNGGYLNFFEVEADKPETGKFITAYGGGTGQNDQFYDLEFGRYNDWEVKLFYNETIHVFTDNWKSLYKGEGTGNLTIGLPGASAVTTGLTVGTTGGTVMTNGLTYVGPTVTAGNNCSTIAPCWSYGGKTYQNGVALAAINGITGTANATTGVMPTSGTTPQSNMALAISNKLTTTPESELSLVRRKAGARFEKRISDNWNAYASYTQEARTGSRPFAMNEGNISTEIAEPIDYTTHDFQGRLQYADSLNQLNLRASMSLFRNNISTMNVQYPLLSAAGGNGVIQTATYDLYPDNNAFNLKGEFARSLPDFYKGRFTAAVSWGTNQQDDALLAPISAAQNAQLAAAGITTLTSTNIGYAANTALVSNWNTTAALSQQTAKQRIDTTVLDLGLAVKPTDALNVKGSYRFYDSANKGGYMAYNPLTGQFGRGFADGNGVGTMDVVVGLQPGATPGTAGSCYIPPGYAGNALTATCQFGLAGAVANGANVPVYGQARSTQQINYGLAADYDLSRTSSINAALEREEFNRNFRERDKTWEDKLKLGYVNRGLGDATLRTSYETDSKRGGDYNYRTFADLGTALPGLDPATQVRLAGTLGYTAFSPLGGTVANNANLFNRYSYYFRKYDQADRDQNIFNVRLNYQAREDLDLGVTLQTKDIKYPDSFYGMDKDKQDSLSLELNYQPSSGKNLYAFYSYQQGQRSMKMNSGAALTTAVNTCTAANITTYGYSACSDNVNGQGGTRPASDAWSMNTNDHNDVLGLGFQSTLGNLQFGVDYTYSSSSTAISYNYGSTAINQAAQITNPLIAGSALPDMTFVQQTLNLNLLIPINKKLSIRLYDRFEVGQVKDWHYNGVITGAVANYDSGTLLLDSGAQDYHANVIGFFIQYKL